MGVLLGVAQLTDFAAALLSRLAFDGSYLFCATRAGEAAVRIWSWVGQSALAFILSIWAINAGYGFSGTGTPLKDFRFESHVLSRANYKVPSINR